MQKIQDWFANGCPLKKPSHTLRKNGETYKKPINYFKLYYLLLSSFQNFDKTDQSSLEEKAAYTALLPDYIQNALEKSGTIKRYKKSN